MIIRNHNSGNNDLHNTYPPKPIQTIIFSYLYGKKGYMDEYPRAFSKFYDNFCTELRGSEDLQFFLDRIANAGGKILEIGVGTGRIFYPAIKSGADIYGIDNSPYMLNILENKLSPQERFRVSLQDVRDFTINERFSLIIAPFRVFSHLLGTEDQKQALQNVAKHLEPGGGFIFDLFVPNLKLLAQGIDRQLDFEGEHQHGMPLRRLVSMSADLVKQISDVTFNLEWKEHGKWHFEEWSTQIRFFFRYEIEHLIQLSPLTLEQIYGGYRQQTLDKDSQEFVIVCKKKEQV